MRLCSAGAGENSGDFNVNKHNLEVASIEVTLPSETQLAPAELLWLIAEAANRPWASSKIFKSLEWESYAETLYDENFDLTTNEDQNADQQEANNQSPYGVLETMPGSLEGGFCDDFFRSCKRVLNLALGVEWEAEEVES